MRPIGITFALLLWLLPSRDASCAERQDPYDEELQDTYEERVKMLSDKAKATLAILEKEKFEKIELRMDRPYETFEVLRKQLGLHGVTVRLKNYGEKRKPREGAIPIVNIPIRVFMNYFDQAVGWGWIVYDDGSITYFDNVCSGNEPKDGVFCTDHSLMQASLKRWQLRQCKIQPTKTKANKPALTNPLPLPR